MFLFTSNYEARSSQESIMTETYLQRIPYFATFKIPDKGNEKKLPRKLLIICGIVGKDLYLRNNNCVIPHIIKLSISHNMNKNCKKCYDNLKKRIEWYKKIATEPLHTAI